MVLYLIGLGLFDEQDITLRWVAHKQHSMQLVSPTGSAPTQVWLHAEPSVIHLPARGRGLEAVRKCSRIYLEAYTSILLCEKEKLVRMCRAQSMLTAAGAAN